MAPGHRALQGPDRPRRARERPGPGQLGHGRPEPDGRHGGQKAMAMFPHMISASTAYARAGWPPWRPEGEGHISFPSILFASRHARAGWPPWRPEGGGLTPHVSYPMYRTPCIVPPASEPRAGWPPWRPEGGGTFVVFTFIIFHSCILQPAVGGLAATERACWQEKQHGM